MVNCSPWLLHFLTSLTKFILWIWRPSGRLKFCYKQRQAEDDGGVGVGPSVPGRALQGSPCCFYMLLPAACLSGNWIAFESITSLGVLWRCLTMCLYPIYTQPGGKCVVLLAPPLQTPGVLPASAKTPFSHFRVSCCSHCFLNPG